MNRGGRTWTEVGTNFGVRLRSSGIGRTIVVVPGMEGNGASCMHTVEPLASSLEGRQAGIRMILVDYSAERHTSLAALQETILDLLQEAGVVPWTIWGQSFGCLMAAMLAHHMSAQRLVLVSPFTTLPRPKLIAAQLLGFTPRIIYRATVGPPARWIFGPMSGPIANAFSSTLATANPADVARRARWLDEVGLQKAFAAAMAGRATQVWFGSHDRLVDLPDQIDVFSQLTSGAARLGFVPGSGHVIVPQSGIDFLVKRADEWFAADL